jgi:hypothetical protein
LLVCPLSTILRLGQAAHVDPQLYFNLDRQRVPAKCLEAIPGKGLAWTASGSSPRLQDSWKRDVPAGPMLLMPLGGPTADALALELFLRRTRPSSPG